MSAIAAIAAKAYQANPRPSADRCRTSTRPAASSRVCAIDQTCRARARRDVTSRGSVQV